MLSKFPTSTSTERMTPLWKRFKQRLGLIQKETRDIENNLERKHQTQETEKIRTRIRGL